jgi:hypothetical protein
MFESGLPDPRPDKAVNKRDLSTGENGEHMAETVRVRPPTWLCGQCGSLCWIVAETATHGQSCGYERSFAAARCCQRKYSPSSNLKVWLPGMDSNHIIDRFWMFRNLLISRNY